MSNFDEIKQKAKDTMETIADKSIELYKAAEEKTRLMAKTTKLTAEITLEKGALRKLYREIGQKYYALHKAAPEPEFEQLCAEVTTSQELIDAKQKEIDILKRDAGAGRCWDGDEEPADVEVEIIMRDPGGAGDADAAEPPEPPERPETPDENTAQAENITQMPPQFRI